MRKSGTAVVMLAALVSLAAVVDGPSVERGKELFNSAKLGTSGKSCASCHFGGKGLEHGFTPVWWTVS